LPLRIRNGAQHEAPNTKQNGASKMTMRTLTWHEASATLKPGDAVAFTVAHDIFPDALIPAGTNAVVVENGLNELGCSLILKPDNANLQAALSEWDGEIWLSPPLDPGTGNREPAWRETMPIAVITNYEKLADPT
jgi:hypothetical protein